MVSDVRRARPAGALFYQDGKLIRPSQDCSKAYGYALCFSEVTVLNEGEYCEVPISRIEPDWVRDNLGTHTYSRTDDFEAIGFTELLEQGGVIAVEWPQRVPALLPGKRFTVRIRAIDESVREIEIEFPQAGV